MPVASDIVATYRGPGRVIDRLLEAGQREDRALAILMAFCALVFVAQMPRLSREAHLTGQDLNMLMGSTLMAWIFIAPLLLYGIAALSHLVARIFGGSGTWYGARIALFWSLLASVPIMLLHGLVAGFIGAGPAQQAVGLIWVLVFGWFWLTCLGRAERAPQ
ncbi:YIP1 family protein [Arenibacterium sp. CAU 1754]